MVAPSLIPKKAGDRVKTNRRDAAMLARLHRAGELTAVWVPDAAHEAMRDLVRARATAARVLGKARQHLTGFLLRHGQTYGGQRAWTVANRRWLTTVRFVGRGRNNYRSAPERGIPHTGTAGQTPRRRDWIGGHPVDERHDSRNTDAACVPGTV